MGYEVVRASLPPLTCPGRRGKITCLLQTRKRREAGARAPGSPPRSDLAVPQAAARPAASGAGRGGGGGAGGGVAGRVAGGRRLRDSGAGGAARAPPHRLGAPALARRPAGTGLLSRRLPSRALLQRPRTGRSPSRSRLPTATLHRVLGML